MGKNIPFHKDILKFADPAKEVCSIAEKLRDDVFVTLKRTGGMVGISGGIDSSVTLAIAVKALGKEKVTGIMMPEKDSSPESQYLATKLADKLGIETIVEDLTGALKGFGCYERRNKAVNEVFPGFNPDIHKMKIGINDSGLYNNLPPVFHVTVVNADGSEEIKRLPAKDFRQIVAASNFKQRSRMSMLYYHAENLHYAVIGTPNKHEIEQGFFVKYGDGGADVMPISHLYKTQVYQLAEYLEVPRGIIDRPPTTDTYTAEQTQEEFFYQLPFEELDLLWYGFENGYTTEEVAQALEKPVEAVKSIFINFDRKIKTAAYLKMPPIRYGSLL